MGIPETLTKDLLLVPRDRAVTLLMRHSARFPIIPPDEGWEVMLTPEGEQMAEDLGAVIGPQFAEGLLRSSPVERCRATAAAIARGAGWSGSVLADERISHGFHEPCWNLVYSNGINGIVPEPIPQALGLLVDRDSDGPRLNVMVTHDTVLCSMVGGLLRAPVLGEHWPNYLEGVFFWQEKQQIRALWRGMDYRFREDLCLSV